MGTAIPQDILNAGMKTDLVKPNGKPMEPKDFIICPLTFKATGWRAAVNYDCHQTTIGSGENAKPGWRSSPTQRGHSALFNAALEQVKKDHPVLTADWKGSFYFTHEDGVKARIAYENRVLMGLTKANAKSWGPKDANDQKEDKSRFHILVTPERIRAFNKQHESDEGFQPWPEDKPVTIQALQERFPKLYESKSSSTSSGTTGEPEVKEAPSLDLGDMSDEMILEEIEGTSSEEQEPEIAEAVATEIEEEPDDAALDEIEGVAEEAVAASTEIEDSSTSTIDVGEPPTLGETKSLEELRPPEETVKGEKESESGNTHTTEEAQFTTLTIPLGAEQPVTSDVIVWRASAGEEAGQLVKRYLVYIERLDREEWIAQGSTVLDGEDVHLSIKKGEPKQS